MLLLFIALLLLLHLLVSCKLIVHSGPAYCLLLCCTHITATWTQHTLHSSATSATWTQHTLYSSASTSMKIAIHKHERPVGESSKLKAISTISLVRVSSRRRIPSSKGLASGEGGNEERPPSSLIISSPAHTAQKRITSKSVSHSVNKFENIKQT